VYEQDFYAWLQDQAGRLRAWLEELRTNGIDLPNLIDELEALGRSQRNAIESCCCKSCNIC
jgi:hypothetical protein